MIRLKKERERDRLIVRSDAGRMNRFVVLIFALFLSHLVIFLKFKVENRNLIFLIAITKSTVLNFIIIRFINV